MNLLKKSEKYNRLTALLINILFFAVVLLLFKPNYDANDDNCMISLLCGAYGNPDGHIVWTNYIIGLFLSTLYRLKADFVWYTLFYFLLMFIAFTEITAAVLRRARNHAVRALLAVVLLFGYLECFTKMNFTRTASILAIAGMTDLADAIASEEKKPVQAAAGVVLCLLSFMVRYESLFLTAAMYGGILILSISSYVKGHEKNEIIKRAMQGVVALAVLGGLVLGAKLIDDRAYSSKEWKEYEEYNRYRGELLDFGWPDYEKNKELYTSLNISESDLWLYQAWDFYDTEILNTNALAKLVAAKEKQPITGKYLLRAARDLAKYWLRSDGFRLCILLAAASIVIGKHTKAEIAAIGYTFAVFLLTFLYLYYLKRWNYERVSFGQYYPMLLCLLFSLGGHEISVPKKAAVGLLVLPVVVLLICCRGGHTAAKEKERGDRRESLGFLAELAENDNLYFADTFSAYPLGYYTPLEAIPAGSMTNIVPLGIWLSGSPPQKRVLEKWGVTNPFRALAEKENAYLVDGQNMPLIHLYLKEHYDKNLAVETVKEARVSIYRFSHEKQQTGETG